MKHILYATTGIALALAWAAVATPASADVDVLATINKNKDINITETITVNKTATIVVGAVYDLQGAAEAQAVLNVDNHNNTVNGADPSDPNRIDDVDSGLSEEYGLDLDASMTRSVNENTGVFGFNQDVGNMTNQGNVVSVAGIARLDAVADSQAHADQKNQGNTSIEFERLRDTNGDLIVITPSVTPSNFQTNKHALILNSINDNTGVINVNQNAGNMNNQSNGVSAAIGIGALVALSDADLGQLNSGNYVHEVETVKVGTIQGSVNNNVGVVNVNQSTGNMNNQGNVVSLSAITSGAFINTQSPTQ
jgi:hypothetical protein